MALIGLCYPVAQTNENSWAHFWGDHIKIEKLFHWWNEVTNFEWTHIIAVIYYIFQIAQIISEIYENMWADNYLKRFTV